MSPRSPTSRRTASSTSAGTSLPATTCAVRRSGSPAWRCRSAPTWSSRPAICPTCASTPRSARTCGCRSRPAPTPRWPVRRCSPTSPAARSPSPERRTAGCWCAVPVSAAARRTSSPPPARESRPPTCRGTGRRWSTSAVTCSARASGSPRAAPHRRRRRPRPDPPGAAAEGHLRRQPADPRAVGCARWTSSWTCRPATSGCDATSTATRSCPTTSTGSRSTATRATTSRSPVSCGDWRRSAARRP